jgi:hypothetical protein
MISFPLGTQIKIDFDEKGNIVLYGTYQLLVGEERHFLILSLSELDTMLAVGRGIVKFCEEHQAKVPRVFVQAMEQDDEQHGPGVDLQPA